MRSVTKIALAASLTTTALAPAAFGSTLAGSNLTTYANPWGAVTGSFGDSGTSPSLEGAIAGLVDRNDNNGNFYASVHASPFNGSDTAFLEVDNPSTFSARTLVYSKSSYPGFDATTTDNLTIKTSAAPSPV